LIEPWSRILGANAPKENIMTVSLLSERVEPAKAYASMRYDWRQQLSGRAPDREANESFVSIVTSLLTLLFAKHRRTGEHSIKTARLAGAVARRCGLTEEETRRTKTGALLHDIGKLEVPEALLYKTTGLTTEEVNVMRRHVDDGARVLAAVPRMDAMRAMVRHHHERWDGGGYPAHLRGLDIPLGARIIAVVDAYDAMTSDRPYRRRLSPLIALERLRDGAGTQFDPSVVSELVEHLASGEHAPHERVSDFELPDDFFPAE